MILQDGLEIDLVRDQAGPWLVRLGSPLGPGPRGGRDAGRPARAGAENGRVEWKILLNACRALGARTGQSVVVRGGRGGHVECLADHPRYHQAERLILVCDNLNAHTYDSFYRAFPPAEAHRLAQRVQLVFTPQYGSWLNMAEPELSVLTRQALEPKEA